MFNSNYSPADISALSGSGEGSWLWILVLILILGGGLGHGLGGGNIVYGDTPATTTEVYNAMNTQNVDNKLGNIQNAITANGYENAQLINNSANAITSQISQLGYQMQNCCCELKTQMLQDKYDDVRYQLEQANTAVANSVQTQNILNALGRYYTYPAVNPYSAYGTVLT